MSVLKPLTPSEAKILTLLCQYDSMTRNELAELTGLTQPTITRLVNSLIKIGALREGEKSVSSQIGRPPSMIELVPETAYSVGFHVTASSMEFALVNLKGEVFVKEAEAFAEGVSPEFVLCWAENVYHRTLRKKGIDEERVLGAGLGVAGVVDSKRGINTVAYNLRWQDVPLGSRLQKMLGIPVIVESNVRAMALAEKWFGVGRRGIDDFLVLYVGTGVGGAIVVGGNLHLGRGAAGEIGHTQVDPDGPLCSCGSTGCLEVMVSDRAILRNAERMFNSALTIDDLLRLEKQGDMRVQNMLEQSAGHIGTAISHAVDLLDPEAVVFAGRMFSSSRVMESVEQRLRSASLVGRMRHLPVLASKFGTDVGVVGAATLVFDCFFREPYSRQNGNFAILPSLSTNTSNDRSSYMIEI